MTRPDRQRLAVDLPVLMHQQLKEIAALHNRSITDIVQELISGLIVKMKEFE